MVNETYEYNLPDALMPAALEAWQRCERLGTDSSGLRGCGAPEWCERQLGAPLRGLWVDTHACTPARPASHRSVDAADLPDVKTGIPTPAAAAAKPTPDGAGKDASAPAPTPAKPASGSPLAAALSPAMLAAAALAAALVLA